MLHVHWGGAAVVGGEEGGVHGGVVDACAGQVESGEALQFEGFDGCVCGKGVGPQALAFGLAGEWEGDDEAQAAGEG